MHNSSVPSPKTSVKKKVKWWKSLRTKIIAWSFVPTLIILSAVAWFTYYSYQKVIGDQAIKQFPIITQPKAIEFTQTLNGIFNPILVPILLNIDTDHELPLEVRAQNILINAPSLDTFDGGIYILDQQGKVIITQPPQPDLVGQDWSDTPHFRSVHAEPNFGVWTDLITIGSPNRKIFCAAMAMTAALAVVFETVPWLRGAVGNVVYFFLWTSFITVTKGLNIELPYLKDPLGSSTFTTSLYSSAFTAFPNDPISKSLRVGSFNMPGTQIKVFDWPGLDWTPGIVGGHWVWVLFGLGLVLLSALWFARFDPSREGSRRLHSAPVNGNTGILVRLRNKIPAIALPSISPFVSNLAQVNPFLGVLFAELHMLLNGRRWWWWTITIGLNIAILISPLPVVKSYLLPAAWLWPIALWSGIGNRERKNNTSQMDFTNGLAQFYLLTAAGLLLLAAFWRGRQVRG